MNSNREPLVEFIRKLMLEQKRSIDLTDTTELIESQILDSVNLVKLILVIQEIWKVEVNFNDLDKQNFKNLIAIRETIERLARR